MKLATAWTVRDPIGKSDRQQRRDVLEQVAEWAATEPNIESHRVVRAYRPFPDRHYWWTVVVELNFRPILLQKSLGLTA